MAELKIADETSVATMEKAAKFRTIGGLMTFVADQTDFCPYCRSSFEIICVKFRFNGATMIATCPNCGMACAERWGAAEILNSAEKSYRTRWNFWPGIASMMDALNLRFRHVVAFIVGALIVAAVLRHTIHVYGGFSREEIRAGALAALPAVVLAIIFLQRKRG